MEAEFSLQTSLKCSNQITTQKYSVLISIFLPTAGNSYFLDINASHNSIVIFSLKIKSAKPKVNVQLHESNSLNNEKVLASFIKNKIPVVEAMFADVLVAYSC